MLAVPQKVLGLRQICNELHELRGAAIRDREAKSLGMMYLPTSQGTCRVLDMVNGQFILPTN